MAKMISCFETCFQATAFLTVYFVLMRSKPSNMGRDIQIKTTCDNYIVQKIYFTLFVANWRYFPNIKKWYRQFFANGPSTYSIYFSLNSFFHWTDRYLYFPTLSPPLWQVIIGVIGFCWEISTQLSQHAFPFVSFPACHLYIFHLYKLYQT